MSNNNQIKSSEAEFISKNSILPNNTSNTKKETNLGKKQDVLILKLLHTQKTVTAIQL